MAFFILYTPFVAFSEKNYLSEWYFLLHYKSENFQIKDPKFFVKGKPGSPEEELANALELLKSNSPGAQKFVCQFPARYQWIRNNFFSEFESQSNLNLTNCPEYQEYRQKVPVDNIYLVFAAENISSPMSMMGHVFVMLEGDDTQQIKRQHAVSYFAIINSFNPVLLIAESLFTGQQGKFGLSPYQKTLVNYTEKEGRSVWEYQLKTTPESRFLVRDHIFELKDIQPDYLFTHYNCATFIYDFLTLLEPGLDAKRTRHSWITPRDLVKDLVELNAFESQTIYINPIQAMKLVKWEISPETKVLKPIHFSKPDSLVSFAKQTDYNKTYIKYLNEYFLAKNKISFDDYRQVKSLISSNLEDEYFYFPKPENAENDSQGAIGIKKVGTNSRASLSFMPASHKILDSSAAFFTENALQLGEIELSIDNKSVQLEQLTIYGVKNLNSIDPHVKNVSWGWVFELNRDEPIYQNRTLYLNTEFGLGASIDLTRNLLLYNLNYMGVFYNNQDNYVYFKPQLGLIANFNNQVKADISSSFIINDSDHVISHKVDLSFKLNRDYRIITKASQINSSLAETSSIELKLVKYF